MHVQNGSRVVVFVAAAEGNISDRGTDSETVRETTQPAATQRRQFQIPSAVL